MHIHSRYSANTIMTVWTAAKKATEPVRADLDDAVLDSFVRRLLPSPTEPVAETAPAEASPAEQQLDQTA